MNKRKIYYTLHSGKNSKLAYYVKAYGRRLIPHCITRALLKHELGKLDQRDDKEYIRERVDYYNKLSDNTPFDHEAWTQKAIDLDHQPMTNQTVYYHDAMEIARYFNGHLRWILRSGDPNEIFDVPTVAKSRPIADNNQNCIVLKMDKVRHFLFVDDKKTWHEKKDMAIFRGDLGPRKENRDVFMNRFAMGKSSMVDAASTNRMEQHPEWMGGKLTIGEHLDYKFIMSLEGNDVASNLKWVMSSNSIAVSPRLTCETWFMEGRLKPNYHYIEVKPDFSDLEERLQYYIDHPDEAEAIIRHAHEYVDQFRDNRREKLIGLMVLEKYFKQTNR